MTDNKDLPDEAYTAEVHIKQEVTGSYTEQKHSLDVGIMGPGSLSEDLTDKFPVIFVSSAGVIKAEYEEDQNMRLVNRYFFDLSLDPDNTGKHYEVHKVMQEMLDYIFKNTLAVEAELVKHYDSVLAWEHQYVKKSRCVQAKDGSWMERPETAD